MSSPRLSAKILGTCEVIKIALGYIVLSLAGYCWTGQCFRIIHELMQKVRQVFMRELSSLLGFS